MLLMVMIYQGKNRADHHHLKNQRSAFCLAKFRQILQLQIHNFILTFHFCLLTFVLLTFMSYLLSSISYSSGHFLPVI